MRQVERELLQRRTRNGAVAQLGERLVRNQQVMGSIPFGSIAVQKSPLNSGLFVKVTKS